MTITTIFRTSSGVDCPTHSQAENQETAERLVRLHSPLPGGMSPQHAEKLLRALLDAGAITPGAVVIPSAEPEQPCRTCGPEGCSDSTACPREGGAA